MKKSVLVFCVGVLSLIAVSCMSDGIEVSGNQPVVIHESSTVLYPERPAPSENRDMLCLRIATMAGEADADFVHSVDFGISGGFSSPDVKVVENGSYDFLLEVRPRLSLFDQTGENYIYEGEVSLLLRDAAGSRVYASKTFHWKGNREFGKETAIRKMAEQIVAGATAWTEDALKTVASQDYASAMVTVQLPKSLWEELRGSRNKVTDRSRVLEATREIAKLKGILKYELTELDTERGMARFRVVYLRKDYPAGVVNAIGDALNHSALVK